MRALFQISSKKIKTKTNLDGCRFFILFLFGRVGGGEIICLRREKLVSKQSFI